MLTCLYADCSTGGATFKKIPIFRLILGGVNSVSGEKLHDFEIIYSARGFDRTPALPSAYGPVLRMLRKFIGIG